MSLVEHASGPVVIALAIAFILALLMKETSLSKSLKLLTKMSATAAFAIGTFWLPSLAGR